MRFEVKEEEVEVMSKKLEVATKEVAVKSAEVKEMLIQIKDSTTKAEARQAELRSSLGAVESSLAHTLKRLGCRSDNPLEWKPPWDWEKELSDDLVIEAYLKARWRSGADTLATAGWRDRRYSSVRARR